MDPIQIFKWFTTSGYPPKNAPVYDARHYPLEKAMGTHRIIGDRFCYDKETQIFTNTGWIPVGEIKLTHSVATLNLNTKEVEYHTPEGISHFYNRKPLIRIGGTEFAYDLLVTPEHTLLLKCIDGKENMFSAKALLDLAKHETFKNLRYSMLVGTKAFNSESILSGMQWERVSTSSVYEEPYTGRVSCLTVQNHAILVRRNGKIVWCGNTGKSALGETIAFQYWNSGATIFDLWAANDQEGAAWLDSDFAEYVTLLVGSNCKLLFDYKDYKYIKAIDLEPKSVPPRQIYVACKRFFQTEDDYYKVVWILSEKFRNRTDYDRVDVIFMREAQEVITGVMRAGVAHSEKDAASAFMRFHNTLFHFGYAVILDSQRDVEISKSIRELSDWTYFKNLGGMEIPRKIWHIFRNVNPDRVLRKMEPHQFVIYSKGTAGLGVFKMPPWHLERGKDILVRLGIHPQFEGLPNTPTPSGTGSGGPGRPKELVLRQEIRKMVLAGSTYLQITTALKCANDTITKVKKEMKREGVIT